ncbi:glycosyltransferase family 2 protein [Brachybacterium sp. DNPG3]
MHTRPFSVIIPTLQRSPILDDVVRLCAAHPLVLEVLVINNAPEPLSWDSPRVRVLDQGENIFVNPAWNLGVRESRGEFLAIVNDDVTFAPQAFDIVARALRRRLYGVIGPDRSAFSGGAGKERVTLARTSGTIFGFGVFMCLRREDYLPVPEQMRIWGGDDWLISTARRPPGAILGVPFETEMSTTSGSPEIQALREQEQAIADEVLHPLSGTRWWHRPWHGVESARMLKHRLSRR